MSDLPSDNPDRATDPAGGTGAISKRDYDHQRGDLRMKAMAIRNRWIIPSNADEVLPNEMYQIATTREVPVMIGEGESAHTVMMPNSRAQIAATKVLIEMTGQNQADEHKALDADRPSGPEHRTVIVVNHVNRLPDSSEPSGTASGAEGDRPSVRPVQRFDVRKTLGEDNTGGVVGG